MKARPWGKGMQEGGRQRTRRCPRLATLASGNADIPHSYLSTETG